MANPWRNPLDGRYVSKKSARFAFTLLKIPFYIIKFPFLILKIIFRKK